MGYWLKDPKGIPIIEVSQGSLFAIGADTYLVLSIDFFPFNSERTIKVWHLGNGQISSRYFCPWHPDTILLASLDSQ